MFLRRAKVIGRRTEFAISGDYAVFVPCRVDVTIPFVCI
jgi:hypothetical protein